MKYNVSLTNLALAVALIGLLIVNALPTLAAQAANPQRPSSQSTNQADSGCDSKRTIQVTGSASINVIPDRATIQLGVQSNGISPETVQTANSIAIQKVFAALRGLGVAEKDIATDVYVIEPVYDNYNSLYIKGYRINNMVAVTLREVAKTSQVIAAALEAGANQVVNVDFYTTELRKYRDQARELAMKAAKEKAQALATAAGAQTGCVLNISENSFSYYNGWWYGRSQAAWTQNTIQNAAQPVGQGSGSSDEPVSLGQISVKAEISATFAIE